MSDILVFDQDKCQFCPLSRIKGRLKSEPVGAFEIWLKQQMANKFSKTYVTIDTLSTDLLAGRRVVLACKCNPKECEGGKIKRAIKSMAELKKAWGGIDAWLNSGRKQKES